MMFRKALHICVSVLLIAFIASCSNTKNLPAGDSLFIGSKVHIDDRQATKKERKVLTSDLAGVVRPRPNSTTLGIRFKLTIYNMVGDTKKKKGLKHWLRTKVGEPPVLASSVHMQANKELMVNLLQNRGFFYPKVTGEMKTSKKRKSTAIFHVTTGPQYTINRTQLVKDSSQIIKDIDSNFDETLLKPNLPYNLDLIKAERNRIDRMLKEGGYYFFKPDYILVQADTTIGNHQVNMYVKLKDQDVPDEAYNIYKINNIYLFPDFRLRAKAEDTSRTDTVMYKGYIITDPHHHYRPSVFYNAMNFEKGDEYSLDDQNTTLSRLVNMGTFKYVKNRFEPIDDSLLDVFYYLAPYPRKSLGFTIGGLTQNDNRAGSQGSVSFRNRNVFKGAEEFIFKINGGFEAQYSGIVKQPDIYNVGAETDLTFPRFLVPFVDIQTTNQSLPRSIIKLQYNYESESKLLRINSYKASFGYDWKEGIHKEHQFYPFNFIYVKTDTLGYDTTINHLYGSLIFDGIILGPTYEYTYNSQVGPPKKNEFYFDGLIDLSGNILGLAQNADYEKNPKTILGSRYAQYIKLQPDFRYYLRFSNATSIASRVMAGIGIPYGNSDQLPNIKQFWAGGNSDLRGFPSRLVGPGTFNEYYEYQTSKYIETLGDMKFEFNTEVRQNIYKFINMAAFFDAGNIWLYHNNPNFPGGQFTSNWYKELAANVGIGLRFDFTILLLRLDLGMPVRDPWLPDGQRWVFNKIDFGDPSWRKQNLVLNIAIGYPF